MGLVVPRLMLPRFLVPTRMTPTVLGGGSTAPTETLNVVLPPASWLTTMRAGRDGWIGSTYAGAYVAIPGNGSTPDRYVWWNAGQGIDPGDWVAALSGFTGVEVTLTTGVSITAANVATATRSALSGSYTVGGAGATVSITGDIDASAATTGTSAASASSTRGMFGCRAQDNTSDNTLVGTVSSFGQAPAANRRVNGIGIYLTAGAAGAGEQISLAIYTGGSSDGSSLVGTTLLASGVTVGAHVGWNWVVLTEPVTLPANAYYRLCAKGQTSTTRNAYISTGTTTGIDFDPSVQLQIYDSFVDPDVTVPWPASLNGAGISSASVFAMIAISYETTPYRGNASWMQMLGVHTSTILGASESALTSPDPLGANVCVAIQLPAALGMEYDFWRIGIGGTHTDQFRGAIAQGGVFENPNGATIAVDLGLTTGSATNAYLTVACPGPGISAIPATSGAVAWWMVRGNGGITIRYADNGNPSSASPTDDPFDLVLSSGLGDGPEYEMNSTNTMATNPATAYPASITTAVGDFLPGNYPSAAIGLRINPITLSVG